MRISAIMEMTRMKNVNSDTEITNQTGIQSARGNHAKNEETRLASIKPLLSGQHFQDSKHTGDTETGRKNQAENQREAAPNVFDAAKDMQDIRRERQCIPDTTHIIDSNLHRLKCRKYRYCYCQQLKQTHRYHHQ